MRSCSRVAKINGLLVDLFFSLPRLHLQVLGAEKKRIP